MGLQSILVVDDERDIAEVVVFLLTAEGYQASFTCDGQAALDMLAHSPVDLLLTDFMMPGVNGSELVRAMRSMEPLAATPVLMMSALPEHTVRQHCALADEAFLRKPFTSAQLLDAVRRILA